MTTVTVSMPESLKGFLDEEVATKGYGNVSEYIRTLLREAQSKAADARLQALLLEGLASGDAIPVNAKFWNDLRSDAAARLAKQKKSVPARSK